MQGRYVHCIRWWMWLSGHLYCLNADIGKNRVVCTHMCNVDLENFLSNMVGWWFFNHVESSQLLL